MITFNYDNISTDKIILEIKCIKCQKHTKTSMLQVPPLDLDNDLNIKTAVYKHKCDCGQDYTVKIYNGIYKSYGEIMELQCEKDDFFVDEISDIPNNKDTIYYDTLCALNNNLSIVENIDKLDDNNRDYLYNLLFANIITIIDAYIKISTESIVLSNDSYIDRFINIFNPYKCTKSSSEERIINFYNKKSFQSLNYQDKLFNDVFGLDIRIDNSLLFYETIRNIIIHRNSIAEQGFVYKVSKKNLLQAINIAKNHIALINKKLINLETNNLINNLYQ